jgi:endonuclease G, mitochondrial
MKPGNLGDRKFEVWRAAGTRWQEKADDRIDAAERLGRGGPLEASEASRSASFLARESLKGAARFGGVGLERIIGDTLDLDDMPPTLAARQAGQPVARVVELLSKTRIGEGFATAFQVAPGLMMTNWHVFEHASDATGCGVQFGYERGDNGLLEAGVVFELDPSAFFLSDQALDVALVAVRDVPVVGQGSLGGFSLIRLIPTQGKILVGQPISIIQHPDGRHKHWAVRENKLVADPKPNDAFLSYTTDTLPGSSGSPAFNYDWELVALHHSGVPRMENGTILTKKRTPWTKGMPDATIDWVANEGVRVSRVHAFLKGTTMPTPAAQAMLESMLSTAVDPVGAVPKIAEARPVNVAPPAAQPATVNIVVNGPGHFYLGGDAGRPVAIQTGDEAGDRAGAAPLPVTVTEKKIRFDANYDTRPGFDPAFLKGFTVPHPGAPLTEVLKSGNKARVLDYHHYSLVMHKQRRLAMWTASNVDYDPGKRRKTREGFGEDTWKADPRIPADCQIEDLEFYEPAAKFDRGHLVRRDDVAWGKTAKEEEFGNSDSFHWTNCTPQHEGFNRDVFGYKGLWGQLENHLAKQAGFVANQLIVFAGPILADDDPSRDFGSDIEVTIPVKFWKVIVVVEDTGGQKTLRAYGFVLDQTAAIEEYGWEGRFRVGKFSEQQRSLADITGLSRVTFDATLHEADPMAALAPDESRPKSLAALADIRLR